MPDQSAADQKTTENTIVLVTTADTDVLTADRALSGITYPGFPLVAAFNPSALDTPEAQTGLLEAVATVLAPPGV